MPLSRIQSMTTAKSVDAPAIESEEGSLSPRAAWYLTIVLFLAAAAAQIDRQMISLLVEPIKADLGFSDAQMGLLMGFAFSAGYACCAPFVGGFADRVGRKRVLSVGLLLWSSLTMLTSVAAAFPVLVLLRVAVGIGESTFQPTSLPMVAAAFPPHRRAVPIAVCVAGLTVGMTLTPLLAGAIIGAMADRTIGPFPLVGALNGWRMALLVGGAIGLLVLLLLSFAREPAAARARAEAVPLGQALRVMAGDRVLYAALIFAPPLFAMAMAGMTAWMPSYLSRGFGLAPSSIGLFLGAAWLPSIVASPIIAGWLVNRASAASGRRGFFVPSLWLMPAAGMAMIAALLAPDAVSCFALYLVSTIVGGVAMTFGTVVVQQLVVPALRSHVTGLFAAALSVVGWGLGPWLIGVLATIVFGEAAIGMAIIAVVAVAVPLACILNLCASRT